MADVFLSPLRTSERTAAEREDRDTENSGREQPNYQGGWKTFTDGLLASRFVLRNEVNLES
jgi:hypothetical protein